jgi:hypothetical protein
VAFRPISIARDLGDVVEVSSGLSASDRVVDSPPDGIATGDQVRIAPGSASGTMLAATPTQTPSQSSRPAAGT